MYIGITNGYSIEVVQVQFYSRNKFRFSLKFKLKKEELISFSRHYK